MSILVISRTTCLAAAACLMLILPNASSSAQRVPWTSSRVVGSPEPPKPYHVERVYPALQFNQPVELMPLADTGRMMLLELGGNLLTFVDDPECQETDMALDMRTLHADFNQGLGFAAHPNFEENREIFVVYRLNPIARADGTRLSRLRMNNESPPRVVPGSEEVLLTWHCGGHNGCAIRFDSKGYLYFSTGDGARPYPPDEYDVSQDLSDLRSTICRIDVDRRQGDMAYAIPPDNPFIDTPNARPEIWAYGFRNPWRYTIDPTNDRLLCGDVGWERWELVFDVRRGGNYGWSLYEGPQPIRGDLTPGPTPIRKPIVSYPHSIGQSVTGGVVYHGNQHPELRDSYLYGDYVTGLVWGLRYSDSNVTWNPVLAETGLRIITFAQSRESEVLIVDYDGGIYQLTNNPMVAQPSRFPRRLSETGLFESTDPLVPAAGVVPYELAAESWQAGTTSDYLIAVPGTETIKINKRQRSWAYPDGTVVARTISRPSPRDGSPSVKLETQILHFNGSDWQPYSFAWDEGQSDAELVGTDGVELTWSGEGDDRWSIPNRAQCRACHSRQNGGAVGFTLANLDRPCPDDPSANQVERFVRTRIIDRHAPGAWNIHPMVDPHDETADLEKRARSYLTANCIHCHSRGGGGTVPLDLTYANTLDELNAVDAPPMQGAFDIDDARVIAPGDPYRSVLYYRIATSGTGHMPKMGPLDNDVAGLKLIHDWIVSLGDGTTEHEQAQVDMSQIVSSTSSSLRLYSQLLSDGQDGVNRTVTTQGVAAAEAANESGNAVTTGIFERFLPADQRRKRLGDRIDAEAILAIRGDAQRGREIFFDSKVGRCLSCHRVQGGGHSVGPDLDGVATKRTRPQLLSSVLTPASQIEPSFASHLVLTDDGTVLTGLKVREDQNALVIRQADGKDRRVDKDRIESVKILTTSLMPDGLAADLTAQELADLLAFLASLK